MFITVIHCTLRTLQSPSDNQNKLHIQSSLLAQIRAKETSEGGERNPTLKERVVCRRRSENNEKRHPLSYFVMLKVSQHKRVNATVTVSLFLQC